MLTLKHGFHGGKILWACYSQQQRRSLPFVLLYWLTGTTAPCSLLKYIQIFCESPNRVFLVCFCSVIITSELFVSYNKNSTVQVYLRLFCLVLCSVYLNYLHLTKLSKLSVRDNNYYIWQLIRIDVNSYSL